VRYAFQNRPAIGYFNLRCLAQALTPLVTDDAIKAALDAYEAAFAESYGGLMRAKLGLQESRPEDETLIRDLLELMRGSCADYTNLFRALCGFKQAADEPNEAIRDWFVDRGANSLAHTAICLASEQKDFSEIERLHRLLADPFAEHQDMDRYAAPPPDWGKRLIVSCSS
jgi:hypothetical protein